MINPLNNDKFKKELAEKKMSYEGMLIVRFEEIETLGTNESAQKRITQLRKEIDEIVAESSQNCKIS